MPEKQEEARNILQEAAARADGSGNIIIAWLMRRIGEDEGFAEDVSDQKKSFEGCMKYIRSKARQEARNGMAMIEDKTVYEWAEDYYRGTAEAIEKVLGKFSPTKQKAAEGARSSQVKSKVSQKKPGVSQAVSQRPDPDSALAEKKASVHIPATVRTGTDNGKRETANKVDSRKKKKSGDIDGQMSLFDFMGVTA